MACLPQSTLSCLSYHGCDDDCTVKIDNPLVEIGTTDDGAAKYCGHSATVWCALCYGRFIFSKTQPWLSDARIVSISLPSEFTAHEKEICVSRPASHEGGRFFCIEPEEGCECGCCSYHALAYSTVSVDMSVGDENETCHLPVHAACLELCGQHQRGQLPLSAESLQDSGMGVLSRLAFEYEEQYQDFCGDKLHDGMLMLKADYGALECYEWMDDDQMPTMDDFGAFVYHASCTNKVFDMNPMTIKAKELTDFVLSMLQPLLLPRPTAGQGHARKTTHCPGARLPQEILNMIESYASSSFSNANPEPSRILPQSWWREALINMRMLPWLWDLDVDMIRKKDSKPPKNWFGASGTWVEWDWELLVRKLAQTDFYKDIGIHTAGEGPALALKNRRRIFLIMDDLVRTLPGQPRMKELTNWQDTDCPDWLLICHLVNT